MATLTEVRVAKCYSVMQIVEIEMQCVPGEHVWRWRAIVQTCRPAETIDALFEHIDLHSAQQTGGHDDGDEQSENLARLA